jgi:hypothetical protein
MKPPDRLIVEVFANFPVEDRLVDDWKLMIMKIHLLGLAPAASLTAPDNGA